MKEAVAWTTQSTHILTILPHASWTEMKLCPMFVKEQCPDMDDAGKYPAMNPCNNIAVVSSLETLFLPEETKSLVPSE